MKKSCFCFFFSLFLRIKEVVVSFVCVFKNSNLVILSFFIERERKREKNIGESERMEKKRRKGKKERR